MQNKYVLKDPIIKIMILVSVFHEFLPYSAFFPSSIDWPNNLFKIVTLYGVFCISVKGNDVPNVKYRKKE